VFPEAIHPRKRFCPTPADCADVAYAKRAGTMTAASATHPNDPARALAFDIRQLKGSGKPPSEIRTEVIGLIVDALRKQYDLPIAPYHANKVERLLDEYGTAAVIEAAQGLLQPSEMSRISNVWAVLAVRTRKLLEGQT
jgi:hypothetical protein